MSETSFLYFVSVNFLVNFVYCDVPGIASNDGVHTPDFHEIGTTSGTSGSSGGCDGFSASLGFCTMNGGYQNYQTPIYGNTGYTYGQVNRMYNVDTGSNNGDYNGYSNNYWTCVNTYRGQYYYSYTYGKYICDARANRYG